MYPYPCGWHGDAERQCICSAAVVARYQKRIAGPLLDRINIHVGVPRHTDDQRSSECQGEPSSAWQQVAAPDADSGRTAA